MISTRAPWLDDAVAYAGHQVHVMRRREVGTLVGWLGDVKGKRVLDVAGGDGYWAGQLRRHGADACSIDLARGKLEFGRGLRNAPHLVEGDAELLPFPDASFDAVMSVCAIEHFSDGGAALDEIARVLRPGGRLVMSADVLSRADEFPTLAAGHRERYHVTTTWPLDRLSDALAERGITVEEHAHFFTTRRTEWLYLQLSRHRLAWNLAAPMSPVISRIDKAHTDQGGSVVLVGATLRRR